MVGKAFRKVAETIAPSYMANYYAAQHDLRTIKTWAPTFGGLAGGNSSRRRNSAAFGRSWMGSEEEVCGYGLIYAQLEAMDLYRNNPLARAIVEITRRYAGHSKPRANTAAFVGDDKRAVAEAWDKQATEYFNEYWYRRADAMRRPGVDFGTLQDWYITTQFTQGDIAYVWTGMGLHTIEGIQIATPVKLRNDPKVKYGFRFGSNGIATHMYYHDYNGGRLDTKTYHRVSMNSVIFCPWLWRPASVRAIPRLHGVIDSLRDHE